MRSLKILTLLALAFFTAGCSEEEEFTGNIQVIFASNEIGFGDPIEGMEFGIFPTDYEPGFFASEREAIAVSTIESRACRFDKILMGTYNIRFMRQSSIYKTIQVFPGKTTEVTMLD